MAEYQINRRRFIQAFTAAVVMPIPAFSKETKTLMQWDGISLGADASIKLYHPNKDKAKTLLRKSLSEISRLENMFSLYKDNSVITLLNRNGYINNPPQEFIELLQISKFYGDKTFGEFDITVQPLWNNKGRGVELVDYKKLIIEQSRISFAARGMQITLNGIAQGYITDKVAAMLRAEGISSALVELGEKYAMGKHPLGRKWKVGVAGTKKVVELKNQAISTSNNSQLEHLYDPQTGKIKNGNISVIADNATKADALSTALAGLGDDRIRRIMQGMEGAAIV